MTNTDFLNKYISPADAEIALTVDGHETNLYEFLWTNLVYIDVDHISIEDANRVIALQPGESTFINLTEIRRIA